MCVCEELTSHRYAKRFDEAVLIVVVPRHVREVVVFVQKENNAIWVCCLGIHHDDLNVFPP